MQLRTLVFIAGVLAISSPAHSQEPTQVMLAAGLQHLETARTTRTDTGYAAAEERFTALLAVAPTHARALAHRGEARVMRGVLLIPTSLPSALEFFQSGMADMDRAVSIAPDDLTVRITRGISYVEFPPYYNKQPVARQDLEAAVAHPQFSGLPEHVRDRVVTALQRAQRATAEPAQAGRVDRFPRVAATAGPIMAVASVTFERVRPTDRPAWLQTIMDELYQVPGLVAAHSAASFDQPGMFLIFAWFHDKKALNDFYHGETHQRWMRNRAAAIAGEQTMFYGGAPVQIGIELFNVLPGGMAWGGSFVPHEVRR
jgi:hypothetical protein